MNNKKERRKIRHEKNKLKDKTYKEQAWNSGKLIEEYHDGYSYSKKYTVDLTERLIQCLKQDLVSCNLVENSDLEFINCFRKYKSKIRDLIILWNSEVFEGEEFNILTNLLEIYWDEIITGKNQKALIDYANDKL